jgi:hypothetical protein
VTNNNEFWIGWLDLLTSSFKITLNHNHLQQLTIGEFLRLAPFLTGPRVSSILLWLTWSWFTNQSLLLRMTYESLRTNDDEEWLTNIKVKIKVMLRPASLSWCQAPIWDLRPDFLSVWQLRVFWCGGPSLTRGRVCLLQCTICLHFTCYYINVRINTI